MKKVTPITSNANTIIQGLTVLISHKTVSCHTRGLLMLKILYSAYLDAGKPKAEAIDLLLSYNSKLPTPVDTKQLRQDLASQQIVYHYTPRKVIEKLNLTTDEVWLSGLTKAAERAKAAKTQAAENHELSFALNKAIILGHRSGKGPTEIYNSLPKTIKEHYSISSIKGRWKNYGLVKHQPAPIITGDMLLRYQHSTECNRNTNCYDPIVSHDDRLKARDYYNASINYAQTQQSAGCIDQIRVAIADKRNVLILGDAGTGKSYIIKQLMSDKKFANQALIVAPTGKAAEQYTHARTIHSAFKLERRVYLPGEKSIDNALYQNPSITYLIIDEIGMVRSDIMTVLLNTIEDVRKSGRNLQLICVGDNKQLLPVATRDDEKNTLNDTYHGYHAYCSPLWDDQHFETIKLTRNHRIKLKDDINARYCAVLKELSYMQTDSIDWLNNSSAINHIESTSPDSIYLCDTNKLVDHYNNLYVMDFLPDLRLYQAEKKGCWKGGTPNKEFLLLAPGMRVMLTQNDEEGSYVNGSFGTITSLKKDSISIILDKTKKTVNVNRKTHDGYPGETFSQFPLAVAKAITIHKAQGMTLYVDVNVVLSGNRQPGLIYTALSRVSDVHLLHLLTEIRAEDVIADLNALRWAG